VEIRSNEKDDRVMKILRQRTQEVEVKKFCIRLIEEAGSFQYTKVTWRFPIPPLYLSTSYFIAET
jgi:geranylgeranyl diphosphate synthase type 3